VEEVAMSNVFNFDEWAQLYKTDRAEFERRRKQVIADAIAKAPAARQPKLLQMQWKLDAIHQTTTPISGMLKMHDLMWDSFLIMTDNLNALSKAFAPQPVRPKLTLVK
jgi:hypothetical protein